MDIVWRRKERGSILKMKQAADMEDKTEKSPVTPGEVLPAGELLADMLLAMNKPAEALTFYEADLKTHPARFNGLNGAAIASSKTGNREKTKYYYEKLIATANSPASNRPELEAAKLYLEKVKH